MRPAGTGPPAPAAYSSRRRLVDPPDDLQNDLLGVETAVGGALRTVGGRLYGSSDLHRLESEKPGVPQKELGDHVLDLLSDGGFQRL
jgi:hypothetical protein